jgi:hypothetical protein
LGEESAVDNTPVREIKSVVVPAQFFVLGPLHALGVALGIAAFAVFVFASLMLGPGPSPNFLDPSAFFIGCGIVAVGILIICMVGSGIKAFSRTTYWIYPDRVEYHEGFWNRQWRTVAFDEVIDVGLTEGVLQRTRGAGTVTLTIHPQKFHPHRHGHLYMRGGRIELRNVPQPKEIWELIRSLVVAKGGPHNTAPADPVGSTATQEFPSLDRAGNTAIQEFPLLGRPGG